MLTFLTDNLKDVYVNWRTLNGIKYTIINISISNQGCCVTTRETVGIISLCLLFQCFILGLKLCCPLQSGGLDGMGAVTAAALCLPPNGLSHLLQRMNMRCLRCQHCKWIPGLWALEQPAVACLRHASISTRDDQRAATCFTNSSCLISFLFKEDIKYVLQLAPRVSCAPAACGEF